MQIIDISKLWKTVELTSLETRATFAVNWARLLFEKCLTFLSSLCTSLTLFLRDLLCLAVLLSRWVSLLDRWRPRFLGPISYLSWQTVTSNGTRARIYLRQRATYRGKKFSTSGFSLQFSWNRLEGRKTGSTSPVCDRSSRSWEGVCLLENF